MNKKVDEFNEVLFAWDDEHYRKMPWRTKRRDTKGNLDPYAVLVSELMLQQTQVARVRLKFVEFMNLFPTVFALSKAPLADVLRVWSGLGYNRRAKYLHQTAKVVVQTYGGSFPKDFTLLCRLPGIGPSTASGILAFAWNLPFPMIDTNLRRILTRCFFEHKQIEDRQLFEFAKNMIPEGKGRAWNYAMLDLGAMACTAKNHHAECPLYEFHGEIGEKQSRKKEEKFQHSKRYFRGMLLSQISREGKLSLKQALLLIKNPFYPADEIIESLITDGLLSRKRGQLSLPS